MLISGEFYPWGENGRKIEDRTLWTFKSVSSIRALETLFNGASSALACLNTATGKEVLKVGVEVEISCSTGTWELGGSLKTVLKQAREVVHQISKKKADMKIYKKLIDLSNRKETK